jgi:hypothetical protein
MLLDCEELIKIAFNFYTEKYRVNNIFYNEIPSSRFVNYFISEIYMNTLVSRGGMVCNGKSITKYNVITDDNDCVDINKSRFDGETKTRNLLKLFYFYLVKPTGKVVVDLQNIINNYYFKKHSRQKNKLLIN